MIMPVILWTDALVFLLVAVVLTFALYARSKPHLRAPWRHVLGSRMASASIVILLAYVVIGLLDSLHYRAPLENNGASDEVHYGVEVLSVLDYLLEPLHTRTEKTYSAPFATHLYTRETIQHPDGSQTREYPRLTWGGRHLADPEADFRSDILVRVATACLQALLLSGLLLLLLGFWLARRTQYTPGHAIRSILAGRTRTPLRVILLTLGLLLLLFCLALNLSTAYHVFGTDKVGQDVFYQTLKSIRTGLVIGTLTTLVMLPFAILMGILAGYARGWIDDLIQYIYYVANHPEKFETALERADIRLLFLCIILGITSWTGLCRLLRGESLKLRESEYIKAAVALGVSHAKVITRHILPNVMHIVLITVVLDFSGLVLAEAVLSYVGVGVDPTMNSWGNMINSARLEMAREPVVWWSLLSAFLFMFTLVLAANLFSDAVRDAFDPRLHQR